MKKSNGRKKIRLIPQVMLLFAAAVFAAGFITYFTQCSISDSGIRVQTEALADEVAEETLAAIREYPASDWLLSYWYNHAGELEIEYEHTSDCVIDIAVKSKSAGMFPLS